MSSDVAVKICGVCRAEDAALAAEAGADYVGVILAPGFTRSCTIQRAAVVLAAADGAAKVGVFVGDPPSVVVASAERLRLDVLQLHGDESLEQIAAVRSSGPWSIWKTVRSADPRAVAVAASRYAEHVDGILVDGWSDRGVGGVGARFDWQGVARYRDVLAPGAALIAAGGLNADNVLLLVAALSPDVVDVSSGVEEAPGRKSAERVRGFVHAVRGMA